MAVVLGLSASESSRPTPCWKQEDPWAAWHRGLRGGAEGWGHVRLHVGRVDCACSPPFLSDRFCGLTAGAVEGAAGASKHTPWHRRD